MNKRTTVYNNIVTKEKYEKVNPKNIELGKDFLEYLKSIDRSPKTIEAYGYDLRIFWVWLLDYCDNKFFIDLKKREIAKFQNHCLTEYKWSSSRIRRVKATLSSLSNFVESILDDEYEDFRPIIRKIENPVHNVVREKTIFTKDQLQGLLDNLVEHNKLDQACMLALAMYSGRRKSELPRMKVSYFTEDNVLYGSLYKTPEKVKTKGRGSAGKMLDIYVLKNGFQPYLDMWMQYRKDNNIESEWLIPHKVNGEYIDEQIPITMMDSWAESFSRILGVPFYFHSLRHYFSTSLSEANVPDSVIQDIIGWDSAEMCRIYIDTPKDEKFAKYFDENGVKQVEQKNISDL